MDEGDPRSRFLTALSWYQQNEKEKAAEWVAKSLDACDKGRDHHQFLVSISRVCAETARIAAALRKGDLLEKASEVYERITIRVEPDEGLGREDFNPHLLGAAWALKGNDLERMYRFLSRTGDWSLTLPEFSGKLTARLSVEEFSKLGLAHVGRHPDAGSLLHLVRLQSLFYGSTEAAAAILAAAPDKLKKEPSILRKYVAVLIELRRWNDAYEVALQAFENSKGNANAGLTLARLALKAGKKEKGAAVLSGISAQLFQTRPAHLAEAQLAYEDRPAAIKSYEEALRRGSKPHFPLGSLYAACGRHEDAVRMFNRDLASGTQLEPWPEGERLPTRYPADFPATSQIGKEQILGKLGRDHFVEILLKQTGETPKALRLRIEGLLRRLPMADYDTQQKIRAEILTLDRKATRALKAKMEETEDYAVKQLLREILDSWAEPH